MEYEFRWNEWNRDHLETHGISPRSAEWVVRHPVRGFPQERGNGKYAAWGQDEAGYYLQVIYIFDPEDVVYVIYARPLSEREKRQLRRRSR